jgi:hypothetical protein
MRTAVTTEEWVAHLEASLTRELQMKWSVIWYHDPNLFVAGSCYEQWLMKMVIEKNVLRYSELDITHTVGVTLTAEQLQTQLVDVFRRKKWNQESLFLIVSDPNDYNILISQLVQYLFLQKPNICVLSNVVPDNPKIPLVLLV